MWYISRNFYIPPFKRLNLLGVSQKFNLFVQKRSANPALVSYFFIIIHTLITKSISERNC
jgi:hypothetical protein